MQNFPKEVADPGGEAAAAAEVVDVFCNIVGHLLGANKMASA